MPFNLDTNLIQLPGIGPKTSAILNQAGLNTLADLLTYYPKTYSFYQSISITQAQPEDLVLIQGTLHSLTQKRKGKLSFQTGKFSDSSGHYLTLRWFNQPYLLRSLKPNHPYLLKGKIELFRHQKQVVNPQLKPINHLKTTSFIEPIYPQLGPLKTTWFQRIITKLLELDLHIPENIPSDILEQYQLLPRQLALKFIHQPSSKTQLEQARQRLAFEELFLLQQTNLKLKHQPKPKAIPLKLTSQQETQFINHLPFQLTSSQLRAITEIKTDLGQSLAMNRLLMGDVGSGKTVIAAFAAYLTALNHQITYFMAPTQVLAEQLYHRLQQFLTPHQIKLELITGNHKPTNSYQVLVGTHALLHQSPDKNLGLVIIDEQHKFGVQQREQLLRLKPTPHKLIMTATPIPRTLALTLMSHLDISQLTEKPAYRQPVKTYLVPETKRPSAYNWIKQKIAQENYQVFVVAPLIEDSEVTSLTHLKSATQIAQELTSIFRPYRVGLLHGQLKPTAKAKIVQDFTQGKIHLLVSTTVIEIGIDIPNANIIIIESAERFGLSQLHQLRGRVGRSTQQGYCLLFPSKLTPKAKTRLEALTQYHDGAKLAELDMKLRGPGEIWGTQQHGFFKLKLANIFDTDLVKKTYHAAQQSLRF